MNIGSLIRAEREAKGKTLSDIATVLAISLSTVWELEKQNRGTMAVLERVREVLGLEWIGIAKGLTLGARTRAERLRRNWTKESVSKKAGVSQSVVARVESDRARVSSLCAVLDILAPCIHFGRSGVRHCDTMQNARLAPPEFIRQVLYVLEEIELDPCARPNSCVPAAHRYFDEDEGLSQPWTARTIFCHPPYHLAEKFMRKAHCEWLAEQAECVVLLLPALTRTRTFRQIASDADIIFFKDRLWFWPGRRAPTPHAAPFSSMMMILGANDGVIERAWTAWGGVFIAKRIDGCRAIREPNIISRSSSSNPRLPHS